MRTPWHSLLVATVVAMAVAAVPTSAQQRSTPEWEQFTPDHSGLNSAYIGVLVADSSGGVWAAGTGYDGINHLNGSTWISDLDTRWVQSATATPDGKLLAFANGDIVVHDGNMWDFSNQGGFNEVFFIGHDDQDNIWSVFEPGVSTLDITEVYVARFKDGNWTGVSLPVAEAVTAFTVQPNGVAWVGTETQGLFRVEGDSYTHITEGEGSIPANTITQLALAKDGSLWVGTRGGLAHYMNNKWETVTIGETGIPNADVRLIAPAPDNSLWVLCQDESTGIEVPLVRLVGLHQTIAVTPPFMTTKINTMVVDKSNTLWSAIADIGVARYLGPTSSVSNNPSTGNSITADVAPNPSSESATIRFSTQSSATATVEIVNERGEPVARLMDAESVEPGTHAVSWNGTAQDGTHVADGIYFSRILIDGHQQIVPLVRLGR